jgi:hypothetical protein
VFLDARVSGSEEILIRFAIHSRKLLRFH